MLDKLRFRAPWIALCVVVAAGATYLVSLQQTKKYRATTSLRFKGNEPGRNIASFPSTAANSPQAQWAANMRLLRGGDIAAATARRLRQGLTLRKVSTAVRVSAPREWGTVRVSATWTSAGLAAAIANAYAVTFVAEQLRAEHTRYAAAVSREEKKRSHLSRKERTSPRGRALQSHLRTLQLFEKLQGNVQVTHAASVPRTPSSPRLVRNTALGGVGGLLLGLLTAFVIRLVGRRRRPPEEFARLYNLPLLGGVPRSSALSRLAHPLENSSPNLLPPREEAAFQLIRARLRYFKIDRELRTLLVMSPARGDGKTTVARHLAGAAARIGSVVLLLEADLRTPALAWQLGLQPGPGLADVLIGEVSLWSATQLVDVDAAPAEGPHARSLDVLAAGVPLPPNPGKLIKSQAMQDVLAEARSTYDLVVIDTPPLAAAPDAYTLLRSVDGVIVVARSGRHFSRSSAVRLRASLDAARAPLLGVIANCAQRRGPDVSPEGPYPYERPAESAEARPSDYIRTAASNGPPPSGPGISGSRFSSRFKGGAAGSSPEAELDPHETAPQ